MDDKTSDVINNICTILGGALLLYPIIDQATKTILPEMKKLSSGDAVKELKMMAGGQEEKKPDDKDHESKLEEKAEQDNHSEPQHDNC